VAGKLLGDNSAPTDYCPFSPVFFWSERERGCEKEGSMLGGFVNDRCLSSVAIGDMCICVCAESKK
jgi:hypothetical protein